MFDLSLRSKPRKESHPEKETRVVTMVKVSLSVEDFLHTKLASLESKLRDDYDADEGQLQRMHDYISVVDGGIVDYARSLLCMNVLSSASQIVCMLHIPDKKHKKAIALVSEYLHMFRNVVESLPS